MTSSFRWLWLEAFTWSVCFLVRLFLAIWVIRLAGKKTLMIAILTSCGGSLLGGCNPAELADLMDGVEEEEVDDGGSMPCPTWWLCPSVGCASKGGVE